jgi:hypothetical protein
MWVPIVLGLVSSMEIPIHMATTQGIIEIPTISLAGKDSQTNPVYVSKALEFYAKVSIGGQEFNLNLDLLNSESRVALSQCKCTKNAKYYDPYYSWYTHDVSVSNNGYDSSTETYKLYTDTMTLNTLTAQNQYFLAATKHANYGDSISGSLGLGNSFNFKDENFVKNLQEQKVIKDAVFSLTLRNPYYPTHDSVLTVGKYSFWSYASGKKTKITPDEIYASWSTHVSSFSLDNYLVSSRYIPALFAPSIALMIIPPSEYNKLMADIGVNGCFDMGIRFCSCKAGDYSRFPDLNLKIDGNVYTIYAEDYILYESGYCGVGVLNVGADLYLLGSPFFYNYYAVFDMKDRTITVAPADNFTLKKESSGIISYSTFGILGAAGLGLLAWKIKKSRKSEVYEPMM